MKIATFYNGFKIGKSKNSYCGHFVPPLPSPKNLIIATKSPFMAQISYNKMGLFYRCLQ